MNIEAHDNDPDGQPFQGRFTAVINTIAVATQAKSSQRGVTDPSGGLFDHLPMLNWPANLFDECPVFEDA